MWKIQAKCETQVFRRSHLFATRQLCHTEGTCPPDPPGQRAQRGAPVRVGMFHIESQRFFKPFGGKNNPSLLTSIPSCLLGKPPGMECVKLG